MKIDIGSLPDQPELKIKTLVWSSVKNEIVIIKIKESRNFLSLNGLLNNKGIQIHIKNEIIPLNKFVKPEYKALSISEEITSNLPLISSISILYKI